MNTTLILLFAALEIIAPSTTEPQKLVPRCQREVLAKATLEEREQVFAEDAKNGKKLKHSKDWRKPRPVVFQWKATDGERGPWEIVISKRPDLSDARIEIVKREVRPNSEGVYSYELPMANLEIATTYYWRLTSNVYCGQFAHKRGCRCCGGHESVSVNSSFVTADLAPRWIAIEGPDRRKQSSN